MKYFCEHCENELTYQDIKILVTNKKTQQQHRLTFKGLLCPNKCCPIECCPPKDMSKEYKQEAV